MINGELTLINKLGLHARAASKLVSVAQRYSSTIELANTSKKANGKSIMSLLMLAASSGTKLHLTVEGEDEREAFDAIRALFQAKFDEAE